MYPNPDTNNVEMRWSPPEECGGPCSTEHVEHAGKGSGDGASVSPPDLFRNFDPQIVQFSVGSLYS